MRIPHNKFRAAFAGILCAAALMIPVWAGESALVTEDVAQVMGAMETAETLLPDASGLPDHDALFYGYLLQRAGVSDNATLMADAGSRLSASDKELYDKLKAYIAKIADGDETKTTCVFNYPGFPQTWTAEELGVSNCLSDEGEAATRAKLAQYYDTNAIFDALLSDCPYELYWYDKSKETGGVGFSFSTGRYSGNSAQITLTEPTLTVSMTVSMDYGLRLNGGTQYDPTQVDRSLHDGIDDVVTNAQGIVGKYKNESDYDKLLGYSTEICNLVKYDDDAADDSLNRPYGDPWQIISVFDGDSSTDVVCEGYAKAFKYLCDLSAFDNAKVECYLATGVLSGGTGAGAHMWNIVTMDNGKNYLTDVTNSDSHHNPELLLLRGGTPDEGKYTFNGMTFAYDDDTTTLWDENLLTLDTVDYKDADPEPTSPPAPTSAPVQVRGCSLTLVDDIALNFYLTFDDSIVTGDPDAEVTLTDSQTYLNTRLENAFQGTVSGIDGTVYRFTFNLPAKRMNDKITLRCTDWNNDPYNMITPNGEVITEFSYCVQDYLNRIISESTLKALSESMSAYGYYAQRQFQYNLDNAVAPSASYASKVSAVTADTLAAYAPVDSGAVTGLTAIGDNLTLESAITQRCILKLEGDISDYTFLLDGTPVTPTAYDSTSWRVEIPGIVAKNLDKTHTLTISKGAETLTHECSALSYAYKVLSNSSSGADLQNLVRAMYLYHTEAKAYFNK